MTHTSDGSNIFRINAAAPSNRSNNVSGVAADDRHWEYQSSASQPNWNVPQPPFTVPGEPQPHSDK